jgi:AAA+ superfamily predicted ATPase
LTNIKASGHGGEMIGIKLLTINKREREDMSRPANVQPAQPIQQAQPIQPGAADVRPARLRPPLLAAAFDDLEYGLVGLADAKRRLCAILAESIKSRARMASGAEQSAAADTAQLHMLFTGNAGTGKTVFAQKTADLLHCLGHLPTNRVTLAGITELMGQYAGHAASRTRELIRRAHGGVLFIDDADLLNRPDAELHFSREAIETLSDAMQQRDSGLVVILAGDRARMEALLDAMPRLRGCVAHRIHFADYTHAELLAIAESMLDEMRFELDPGAWATFAEYLARRMHQPYFANARTVRNALDRARLRQSSRLFAQSLAGQALDPAALVRIEHADLPTLHKLNMQPAPAAQPHA